jgi:hypothetical protein
LGLINHSKFFQVDPFKRLLLNAYLKIVSHATAITSSSHPMQPTGGVAGMEKAHLGPERWSIE